MRLRKIFDPKMQAVRGQIRLHNKEMHNLNYLPEIINVIKRKEYRTQQMHWITVLKALQ
jgi:hypothetical protein